MPPMWCICFLSLAVGDFLLHVLLEAELDTGYEFKKIKKGREKSLDLCGWCKYTSTCMWCGRLV